MNDNYTLILSNSQDATADYLCRRLGNAGVSYHRLDTDLSLDGVDFRLAAGDLRLVWKGRTISPRSVSAVVYRRPKPLRSPIAGDKHRQAHASREWSEALEGFLAHIDPEKWINHPSKNYFASHKVHQLTTAQTCGLVVPRWIVTTEPAEAERFLSSDIESVVKPLASGYIERDRPANDTLIYTCSAKGLGKEMLARLPGCPVLFQNRIAKDSDVRLTMIDDSLSAVAIVAREDDGLQRLDIRRNDMRDVLYEPVRVPSRIASAVFEADALLLTSFCRHGFCD